MSGGFQPKGRFGAFVHTIEESIIAVLLGLMTLVTFINVVMRYGFNSQLIWGLELVLILFAWLVLFGISYGFKVVSHLGVDAMLNLTGKSTRRGLGILATLACILYGVLLLKGAWDYWAPFAGLDATSGRWFPTGFEDSRDQGWYETEQVPIPFAQTWLENTFNMGEAYEKLPRLVPYAMLPFAMALMLFRLVQNLIRILRGEIDTIIVSHEAEDAVEEAGASLSKET
ncbi:TRAP transporter small permease [Pelagimonas varians]|uniref:TRAP transporter small permease protein n=1 Tax=Pelagimonas varians TaxID=696760 RepID=A0A238JYT8_9RHOB|nr:TRAP transporter small permease [Pelagimonas varians]PYG33143.1 C4-dicarboxylate transporter DctQ subunit [Pelagimonas varians]SMX35809.1 2,3-diketo-L-gulonate TRAP transporter small permease protein YiaM [Pelagimonas varians]